MPITDDSVTRANPSCLHVLPNTFAPRCGLIRSMTIDSSEEIPTIAGCVFGRGRDDRRGAVNESVKERPVWDRYQPMTSVEYPGLESTNPPHSHDDHQHQ